MTLPTNRTLAIVAVILVLAAPLFASAQLSSRSREAASAAQPQSEVDAIARNLSNKALDVYNVAANQRAQVPVDLYVALSGFAGSARAYSQVVADARDETSLRSAAYRLVTQAMEIDTLLSVSAAPSLRQAWRLVQENLALLSNAYPLVYTYAGSFRDTMTRAGRGTPSHTPAPASGGRFRWRGRVDGSDYIMVQGNQVSISHLEDKFIQDASYELPVPLPQQPVQARLTKLRGRGNVEIVRQPTPDNRYTLTVLIEDPAGGDEFYEFEVVW